MLGQQGAVSISAACCQPWLAAESQHFEEPLPSQVSLSRQIMTSVCSMVSTAIQQAEAGPAADLLLMDSDNDNRTALATAAARDWVTHMLLYTRRSDQPVQATAELVCQGWLPASQHINVAVLWQRQLHVPLHVHRPLICQPGDSRQHTWWFCMGAVVQAGAGGAGWKKACSSCAADVTAPAVCGMPMPCNMQGHAT